MALRTIGTRQLRQELATVLAELRSSDEIVVTQRGEGKAVLLDLERYNQLLERVEFLEDSIAALDADWEDAVPLRELE